MKTLEILIDNNEFQELNIKDIQITLREPGIKLSRLRALKALTRQMKYQSETLLMR